MLLIFICLPFLAMAGYQFYQVNFGILKYADWTAEECIEDRKCVWTAFSNIAFESEFEFETTKKGHLAKWNESIVVGVEAEKDQEKMEALVQQQINYLKQHTELNISLRHKGGGNNTKANIILFFSKDFDHLIYKKYHSTFINIFKRYTGDPNYFFKIYNSINDKELSSLISCSFW